MAAGEEGICWPFCADLLCRLIVVIRSLIGMYASLCETLSEYVRDKFLLMYVGLSVSRQLGYVSCPECKLGCRSISIDRTFR